MDAISRSETSVAGPSPAIDSATATYERTKSPATMAAFWSMSEPARDANFVSGDDRAVHDAAIAMLDRAVTEFEQSRWLQGMELQHQTVASAQRALSKAAWNSFARDACPVHPVRDYIHQDPFTRRSFQKPRGYAGDAVLIDYIYGLFHPEHELNESTPLGRWIANYASNTAAPRAVRRACI